jgi:hypothetical protein
MNTAYNNCQCCGRKTPIFYADIEAYTGLLVGFIRRVNSGYFCADCAQKLSDDAIKKTLSVGLFSIWALYYVPAVLINHGVIKSRIEKLNRITVIDTLPTNLDPEKNEFKGCLFIIFILLIFLGYMYFEFFHETLF